MHPSHLAGPVQDLDLLDLAVLAVDHRLPVSVRPYVLVGSLLILLGMPKAPLYAARYDAGVWRTVTKASAKRMGLAGGVVVFWPLLSTSE